MKTSQRIFLKTAAIITAILATTIKAVAQLPTDSIIESLDSIATSTVQRSAAITPVQPSMQSLFVDILANDAAKPLDLSEASPALSMPISTKEHFSRLKHAKKIKPVSIYALPYSFTAQSCDWKRLWINTGVLAGAFFGTLAVLECLPEDATSWNRAEFQNVSPFKRWKKHVFEWGPQWDHDNPIFNYVLHPYAGAAYFMAARSCGFNFWRSLLYSACISNIGWEFGIEACMEAPSYQDLIITPLVGSILGEGFYLLKRCIVNNGYEVLGSRFLGGFCAFLIDPVNEFVGLFAGNPARKVASGLRVDSSFMPTPDGLAMTMTLTF